MNCVPPWPEAGVRSIPVRESVQVTPAAGRLLVVSYPQTVPAKIKDDVEVA